VFIPGIFGGWNIPLQKTNRKSPQKIRNVAYIYTVNKTKYLSSLSKINPKSKGKYNIR